jgi:DNA replication protein DnaC
MELDEIMAAIGTLPMASKAEVEGRERREVRATRLAAMRDAITEADFAAIVAEDERDKTHALRWARGWLRTLTGEVRPKDGVRRNFLVLIGEKGRGKTVAAGWVLAELGGLYVSMPDLLEVADPKNWQGRDAWERYRVARTLIVDDVGTEDEKAYPPEVVAGVIWRLVNARQGGRHYTVFTTNLAEAQFLALCGERGGDRIQHQGVIATVKGQDLRRKAVRG